MRIEARHAGALAAVLMLGFPASTMLAADGPSAYRLNLDASLLARRFNPSAYQLGPQYRPRAREAEKAVSEAAATVARPMLPLLPPSAHLARQPYAKLIEKAARKAGIDPVLVHAVVHVESGYRPSAISLKGAIGLMQVLPETAARYGILDPAASPQANLKAGTLYLAYLLRLFDNRLDLALAAYNAGEGAVMKHSNRIPPYRETQQYVRNVLAKYNEWHNTPYIVRAAALDASTPAPEPEPQPKKEEDPAPKPARLEYLNGTKLVQSDMELTETTD